VARRGSPDENRVSAGLCSGVAPAPRGRHRRRRGAATGAADRCSGGSRAGSRRAGGEKRRRAEAAAGKPAERPPSLVHQDRLQRRPCHGQQNGQGGFKLSLRGWDPDFDYEQIVKADNGRRVSRTYPVKSLLLLKPSGGAPHGGGVLLKKGSPEYNLVLRWLRDGMAAPDDKEAQLRELTVTPRERVLDRPGQDLRLRVTARYSDGAARDVTGLARYQTQNDAVAAVDEQGRVARKAPGESAILVSYGGEVRTVNLLVPFARAAAPVNSTAVAPTGYVDDLVARKLAKLGLVASGRSTDSEFLRRAYLDTIATLPTPDETRAFLRDPAPDKRARLVDRLLERPEYVDYRALKLADLLRVNGQYLSEEGADTYYRWIHEQVRRDVPFDRLVRDLLTGAREHLPHRAGQLLPRCRQPRGPGGNDVASVSRDAHRLREVPQPPVRELEAARLLRFGRLLRALRAQGRARVRRGAGLRAARRRGAEPAHQAGGEAEVPRRGGTGRARRERRPAGRAGRVDDRAG
jgi:hypothetical protein